MRIPFEVYIDGVRIVDGFHRNTDGRRLTAITLPKSSWAPEIQDAFDDVSLSLFVTPYNPALDFDGLENRIGEMKDKPVTMGELPHLRTHGQYSLDEELVKDNVYDILALGLQKGARNRVMSGGCRLVTRPEVKVPYPITLEEMKYLAMEKLGLSPEQAKNVRAVVEPMTAWGAGGRFVIAGFEYGRKDQKDLLSNVGSMVQHNGIVDHYHGRSADEVRQFLGI